MPAAIIVVGSMTPFTFSIANGIALGIVSWVVMIILAVSLLAYYALAYYVLAYYATIGH